jgi:ribosomal protein S18 acetylase RimI-like enzyme
VVKRLRRRVLRPDMPPEASSYPGDDDTDAVHFAVFADDRLAGCASLYREPLPGDDRADAWRLRGMATAPETRGCGYGGALLEACISHVRERGGGVVWCNAREPAVGFYERYGLRIVSERFEIAGIGPHYRMLTAVEPTPKPERPVSP